MKSFPAPEIVYVATMHINHAALSKMMLESGKHVLCEQPMTMNLRQAEEVLAVAKEEGKLFVDVRCYINETLCTICPFEIIDGYW